METTFTFCLPADEKHFTGRSVEVSAMKNLLMAGENIAVYSEPKVGKMSLIKKVLAEYARTDQNHLLVEIPLLRARTAEDILKTYGSCLIKACAGSPSEIKEIVDKYLCGTHFVFDPEQYIAAGEVLSTTWTVDETDICRIFALEKALAKEKKTHIIALITEFQNILFPEESYKLLKAMERELMERDKSSTVILTGTRFNAMREIFDIHKWFYGYVERFRLEKIDSGEIVNYYYRGFLQTGKVIEKVMILGAVELLRGNMWYLSHLFSIMDQMCHGYVNKMTVRDALWALTSIHESRFFATVCSLTDFQLSLLRAILDGETKFSASNVISKYSLNSSANVKRLKDALIKKEIVWFDEGDIPHIQDPLFELWLRRNYFKTENE